MATHTLTMSPLSIGRTHQLELVSRSVRTPLVWTLPGQVKAANNNNYSSAVVIHPACGVAAGKTFRATIGSDIMRLHKVWSATLRHAPGSTMLRPCALCNDVFREDAGELALCAVCLQVAHPQCLTGELAEAVSARATGLEDIFPDTLSANSTCALCQRYLGIADVPCS